MRNLAFVCSQSMPKNIDLLLAGFVAYRQQNIRNECVLKFSHELDRYLTAHHYLQTSMEFQNIIYLDAATTVAWQLYLAPILRMVFFCKKFFYCRAKLENFLSGRTNWRTQLQYTTLWNLKKLQKIIHRNFNVISDTYTIDLPSAEICVSIY